MVTSALQWWSWQVATETICLLNPKNILVSSSLIEKAYRSLCLAFGPSTLYTVDAQTIAIKWMKEWLKAEKSKQSQETAMDKF